MLQHQLRIVIRNWSMIIVKENVNIFCFAYQYVYWSIPNVWRHDNVEENSHGCNISAIRRSPPGFQSSKHTLARYDG